MKLDKNYFEKIPHGETFATGFIENSSDGLFMTNENPGVLLRWVAKKGYGNDWAIYLHWADKSIEWIEKYGDKVHNSEYIQKLVPCEDDIFKIYRY